MKFARNAAVLLAATGLILAVGACSTPPTDPNAQSYERDRAATGSNIIKRYPTGTSAVDQYGGASTYVGGGNSSSTGGNGLPIPVPGH